MKYFRKVNNNNFENLRLFDSFNKSLNNVFAEIF